LTSAIKPTVSW